MLSATVLHRGTGASSTIRFWDDSTIDTIQIQIGEAVGVHPDRLRIYVQGEFEGDYYAKDARKWENLFLRMSPEGKPVRKNLAIYNSHRSDSAIPFELADYDKTAWMNMDPAFETTFRELRIMGVPEERAWIFPLNNTETTPEYTPPASKTSIDIKSIFKTHHPYKVLQFEVIEHTPELLPQIELLYYPRLRVGSPATVSPDTFRAVTRQLEVVSGVREFAATSAPKPDRVSVVQVRWKLPIVDTDFGNAIRNRFEQIFYGTTLSKDIPVISFFSSRQEQSRHKFFTDNSEKTPFMDLRLWSAWWTASRPVKNKPALLLFRGEGRHSYDRITVTSTEITLSCARGDNPDRKEKETIEDLRQSIKEFLLSVDGLVLNPADVDDDRWILQDASAIVHYTKDLRDADFRRFDCLRSIYEVTNADKLVFRLLRADQSDSGLSDNQVTAIQILKDDENLTSEDLREQIPELTSSESISLLANVKSLLIDTPDLADRSTIRLPAFKFSSKSVAVTHSPDLGRILQYINALRDVLIHPDNADLDAFCPKRAESVEAEIAAAAAPVEVPAAPLASAADDDEFDILAMIAEDAPSVPFVPSIVSEAVSAALVGAPEKKKPAKKVTAARGAAAGSMALYFSDQLHKFDSQTYDPADSQIFRKCDRPRQPVIVPAADRPRFEEGGDMSEYAPTGAGKTLEVTDPDGTVICPELWCATDRIPLTPAQLVEGACPICRGKIRSIDKAVEKTQDTTEFSILQRDAKFAYPGFVKYQSKKNNKPIPCCFMTAQTTKVSFAKKDKKSSSDAGAAAPSVAEAFYVLGETKTRLGELRLGYIPGFLSRLLKIPTDYGPIVEAGNRVQSGQGSFFRVGVGRASTSLPRAIPHMKGRIKSPAENAAKVVMCSFFRTWKGADGEGEDPIARRISSIDKAFREKTLTVLEELEYCCLAAGCRLYVVFLSPTTGEVQTSCFMPLRSTKAVIYTHTILVAIDSADPLSVDYIANVTRTTTSPAINADLTYASYDLALRTTLAALVLRLEETRVAACTSEVPSIEDAFAVVRKMMPDEIGIVKLIRDPYRRIQALYIPKRILLPFRPATQVPQTFLGGTASDVLDDYANISPDDYPSRLEMISALSSAKEIHAGFEYAHDVHDIHHRVVELVTRAGLRVPVASDVATDAMSPVEEIVQTTSAAEEATLAFGKPDPDAVKRARSITYEAEIFDFLLFQLAKDVQTGDYPTLKSVLGQPNPDVDELRPLLEAWMDETLRFSEADEPAAFYGKIRQPCSGQQVKAKCSGLCVWDGASCKVQVKSGVREGLRRDVLAKRLLSTLASNDKIRGVVFENRASPFFSSILYLEFPHEVILSDEDVYNIVRPAGSASA
jgi:hypothetical protein